MPLFLAGNATPTIPHVYSKHKYSGFPMGCADAASVDGRRGSNVYEVNPWLWQFGRQATFGWSISVEATELSLNKKTTWLKVASVSGFQMEGS
jgi:hypothetical protein